MVGDTHSYKRLIRERNKLLGQLQTLIPDSFIRGSIRVQGNKCGKKDCRCRRERNPIPHGPYPYLSYRGPASNHSIFLTKDKKSYADKALANYKKLIKVIIDISEVDFQILRYYHYKLGER